MCVSLLLASFKIVRFGRLLRCADKRTVNVMKVYIERNSIQVELIQFRKNIDFIHVCEARTSMEYRPPSCQTVSIVTEHNGWWSHLADIVHTFTTDVVLTFGKSFKHKRQFVN